MAENKHRVILDERSSLMLNGVSNVDSFADEHIELSGSFGGLDIEGAELKIAWQLLNFGLPGNIM